MVGRRPVLYAALAAAAVACGGSSARPDGSPGGDPDGEVPRPTEITIRVFPELIPSYTGRTDNASLVAFQDGDGPWTALAGTGGIYHATATGRRYGVATGCSAPAAPGIPGITVYYQSVAEGAEVLANGCRTAFATVHVSVEVQGLTSSQIGEVWLGNRFSSALAGLTAEIDHPTGSADLFVRSFDTAPGGNQLPVKLYRGPTLELTTNRIMQVDLDALGAPPEIHPLTLIGLAPGDITFVNSSYATPNSEVQQFPLANQSFDGVPAQYVSIDASMRQPDDVSNILVSVTGPLVGGQRTQRLIRAAMKTPTDKTLTLPPTWAVAAPTMDRSSVPRATFTLPLMPSNLGTSDYLATFSNPSPLRSLSVYVSQGYALGNSSVTITTPDLSSLPGWSASMALLSTAPVNWSLQWLDRNMRRETPAVDGRLSLDSAILGRFEP